MTPDLDALFERARTADILAVVGQPLFRAGRRWRGPCPLCGASKGKRADGAFSADQRLGTWYCFGGCAEGGDVIKLEQKLRGGSRREAAERLAGPAPLQLPGVTRSVTPAVREPSPLGAQNNSGSAMRIWAEAVPAAATPVARYLAGRGIDGPAARAALRRLRYHPEVAWGVDERGQRIFLPAMVGLVEAPCGPTGGVHLTGLRIAAGVVAKTARAPAKKSLGPLSLNGVRGGVWLSAIDTPGPLIVGEGIESTLSAVMLELGGDPHRAAAALSLSGLQGVWLADQWGRIDPELIAADLTRPAFTWPQPAAAPWGDVRLAVDRDMAPIRVKCRRARGGTYEREIGPEERARICAALATQAWKASLGDTPQAHAVRAIAPAAGRDFNDELQARLKRRAA